MKEDRSRDFDFSRDCPELKERLRERFLETALLSEEGLPLTDEELELVSAAGDPLCDCIGAVHGKDNKGATAYLNSAAKLPQAMALGTPVLNLKLRRQDVTAVLRPLVMGYFAGGGMQLQVSCLSREDMLDALEHPERHENLIVRMGGFSEYFNRLSDELKRSVIARTEHEG